MLGLIRPAEWSPAGQKRARKEQAKLIAKEQVKAMRKLSLVKRAFR